MPARKSGLHRVAMSPRRTVLTRSTARLGLRSPSRPRVSPEERRARKLVAVRSGGQCEVCNWEHPGTQWHHRVRSSQGGPWSASNGLLVCHGIHEWITNHPRSARAKGWGLWSHEDPDEEPVYRRSEWVLLAIDGSVTVLRDFPIGGAR